MAHWEWDIRAADFAVIFEQTLVYITHGVESDGDLWSLHRECNDLDSVFFGFRE